MDVSVVVPVLDEEPNLEILQAELVAAFASTELEWEVLYVDDGSTDQSLGVLVDLWRGDEHVRVVQFRKRAGQTSAMAAGFDESRGRVVVTLDGDLQNDPADIPLLLERIEAGADIVAGWRKRRHDGFWLRRLPSILANRLIGLVTRTTIHDTGCSLKAFRRELVRNLPIYAEQHRFLPAMSAGSGARIEEVEVNHRPRRFGRSKYGLGRATRVILDLMAIKLITTFSQRPLQYFAAITVPFALGTVVLLATGLVKLSRGERDQGFEQVLLLAFMLSVMAGVYFLLLGLLAELAVKASDLHGEEKGRRISTARLGFSAGKGGALGARAR
jgi:glycosyltransferase involved in cell wall biosynthesis